MSNYEYTPQTKEQLLGVYTHLVSGAPDNFYQVSNALPEEYRTLESTVAELHRGVDHVFRKERHAEVRAKMHEVIDATYAEFKAGRVPEGRRMSYQIVDLIDQTRP